MCSVVRTPRARLVELLSFCPEFHGSRSVQGLRAARQDAPHEPIRKTLVHTFVLDADGDVGFHLLIGTACVAHNENGHLYVLPKSRLSHAKGARQIGHESLQRIDLRAVVLPTASDGT